MTRFFRFVTSLLAAACAAACPCERPARAEVAVLAGSAAGRTEKAAKAELVNEPFAVAYDAAGTLYGVEYTRGNRLFRIAKPGEPGAASRVEFVAGAFHQSDAKQPLPPQTTTDPREVKFKGLHDVAVGPDGTIYVADTYASRVWAFDPVQGTVRGFGGTGKPGFSGDGGPAVDAEFNQSYCCSLTPDGAALLVADIKNSRLRRIDLASRVVSTIVGNGTPGKPVDGAQPLETPLAGPRAACMAADGTIYLALREGNALVEIKGGTVRVVVNASGKAGYEGDGGPAVAARLAGPKYVSLDRQGCVLIADTENHCIRRYDPVAGTIDLVAGMPPRGGADVGADLLATQLLRPHGCCIDPQGRLVIADSGNDRVIAGDVSTGKERPRSP
jgi:sugar lactone lactonase YvrE